MADRFELGREIGRDGRFERQKSVFRSRVTADGSSGFPAEAGRYHLYVALACPWSHRVVIARRLKGLEQAVGISYADPTRATSISSPASRRRSRWTRSSATTSRPTTS